MHKTIFYRYFVRSVLLLMSSMLALSAAFAVGASRILGAQQQTKMQAAASKVSEYMGLLADVTYDGTVGVRIAIRRTAQEFLPFLSDVADMHILVVDMEGAVHFNSDRPEEGKTGEVLPDRLKDLLSQSSGTVNVPLRYMWEMVNDISMTIARPMILNPSQSILWVSGGDPVGYILVSSYQNSTRLLMGQFISNWALMSIVVVLLSGITAYFSARRQVRPLRQMAICAHCFGRGDFSARADVEELQDGEIRDLAQAFNGMADALGRGEELRRGFIANVSHELKTPMTTISGFIGGILDGTVPEERREETLTIVKEEVMRLSRLVESTANLTRLQTGQLELHPRPTDIAELSLRVLLGFEGRISEKELSVELNIPETDTLYVQADPDSITQVLTNLLDNAVKFSARGGALGLTIRSAAGKVRVALSNEGITIPQEDLPYIFERFYKADRSRSSDRTGLGLGLFLCKSIINAHNEDISVSSENGCTVFTFTLPETKNR